MRESYLSKAQVQELLGVNTFGLWRAAQDYDDFPRSTGRPYSPFSQFNGEKEGEEVWEAVEVYLWAAATAQFADRGAVLKRPLPRGWAPGRWAGCADSERGPALDWSTALGTVRIVHNDDRFTASVVATALAAAGNPDGVVTVCGLALGDSHGPGLIACDVAQPTIEYEADWPRVAQLAGQALPWWPDLLRHPDLIRAWRPDAGPAVASPLPSADETALRRAAGKAAQVSYLCELAVTDMANDIRNDRVESVLLDIRTSYGRGEDGTPAVMALAAEPDLTGHRLPVAQDQTETRLGWQLLAMTGLPEAVAALQVAVTRQPRLLPFGALTEVPVRPGTVIERWTRRLMVCDPKAAHAVLAQGDTAETFFVDPLTDMPALLTTDNYGQQVWRFYAPLSLPATGAELASVVLHHSVWITASDGQVHPAPCTPNDHLWWGSHDASPQEAPAVVNTLLDDLAAVVDPHRWDAPEGLVALFDQDHKHGTELTRATLLHARMTPPPVS
ncbi:hypothetical protein ACEZDB_36005 [Streptacidiphilus sp. N1-3]|uniref:Uncharacterized protein n=1 Tax=Streptacidiphilus alkalitolerans TaxID=3342712 RepID=A0ABV6XCY1_9ACTN